MKPPTQFEKMRANRAQKIALDLKRRHLAEYQKYLESTVSKLAPHPLKDPLNYLHHTLYGAKGEQ